MKTPGYMHTKYFENKVSANRSIGVVHVRFDGEIRSMGNQPDTTMIVDR